MLQFQALVLISYLPPPPSVPSQMTVSQQESKVMPQKTMWSISIGDKRADEKNTRKCSSEKSDRTVSRHCIDRCPAIKISKSECFIHVFKIRAKKECTLDLVTDLAQCTIVTSFQLPAPRTQQVSVHNKSS